MRKIIKNYKKVSQLLSPIALALVLSACETSSTARYSNNDITAPASENSTFYLLKAQQSTDNSQKITLYLFALKAFINEQQFGKAEELISRLAKLPMNPMQLSEWQLSRAQLFAARNDYQKAISLLNFQPSWRLPPTQYKRYYLLKKELYRKLNDTPNAVLSATQAAHFIDDPSDQKDNWFFVRSELIKMQPYQLNALAKAGNKTLSIWIDLINQSRNYAYNPTKHQLLLSQWRASNPDHPAALFLEDEAPNINIEQAVFEKPTHVGVLLPLSGKFASQGEAIKNGILQASIDDPNTAKPSLAFYDTESMSMEKLVKQLQNNDTQFVIGPLQKHKVNQYLIASQNSIPTIAMNVLTDNKNHSTNTCYFTLSPEQEAEQAAKHLAEKSYKFPLVIAPDSSIGKRISGEFLKVWQAETGTAAETAYFKNSAGMQKTVQKAFGLLESQSRAAQINKLFDTEMKHEQRSRRDIDSVYLVANSSELTLLKPFIEVTINPDANPPKLFASSRGNSRVDGMGEIGELQGIEFTDIPLIVNNTTPQATTIDELWPNLSNSMRRLHALGLDAYTLIEQLPLMQADPNYEYHGLTGLLSIGKSCVINRTLPWVKFGGKDLELTH